MCMFTTLYTICDQASENRACMHKNWIPFID